MKMSKTGDQEKSIPVSRPCIDEQDINAVVEVLRSGWITTGAMAAEFEKLVCDRVGCKEAVALTSATAAMHLLLHAYNIGPGDEVITPSMTWVSMVNMIMARGATPVFVDIDKNTLMTTAALISPHITERTKLIIPVHFAGLSLDLQPLRDLADKHQIPLIEDAAHALGTNYQGAPIGSQGTAIFSFHPLKNITTGEGGMFCTGNSELAEQIRRLKFHGLGVDAYDRLVQGRKPQAEVIEPGFKYNLPDMNAVLAIGQLNRLDSINQRRGELAALYTEGFATIDEVIPQQQPDYDFQHSWALYVIRLDTDSVDLSRDDFMQALQQRGIGTGLHFRAVHTQKYFRECFAGQEFELSNTEWNSDRICSIPLFPDMKNEDVRHVVNTIKSVLRKH